MRLPERIDSGCHVVKLVIEQVAVGVESHRRGRVPEHPLDGGARFSTTFLSLTSSRSHWWEETSKARRRDVLSVLLDHVTVNRSTRRGHAGIDPDRLRFEWKSA
ncbi:hypothetical protein GS488_01725 [Rhodococcus hoagii]|nr:hypothetical protein [Prescottella equi]